MKSSILIILVLVFPVFLRAQSVQHVCNKGYANDIKQSSDGGYIVTGGQAASAGDKSFLMKLDTYGNVTWVKTYYNQIELYSYGSEVMDLQNNGYVTVGFMFHDTISNEEITFMKTDTAGVLSWSKMYGNPIKDDEAKSMVTTSNGYLLAGFNSGYGGGGEDFYLLRTDNTGNLMNSKVYGSSLNERGIKIIRHQNGYVFGGYGEINSSHDLDLCFLFLDTSLNIVSSKRLSLAGNQKLFDLTENSDGTMLVAATTDTGQYSPQMLIIKLSSSGTVLWDKVLQRNYCIPYSAKEFQNGFTITGASMTHQFYENSFIIQMDEQGSLVSENYFGDSTGSVINSFIPFNNNILAAGYYTLPASTKSSVYLTRYYYNDTACNRFTGSSILTSPTITAATLSWQTYSPATPSSDLPEIFQSSASRDSALCNSTINVGEISRGNAFTIFPNPANENLSIVLSDDVPGTTIKIYNSSGAIVKIILPSGKTNYLSTVNMPDGIYMIQVSDKNGSFSDRLLIKH